MPENLKLLEANFCRLDGYFYTLSNSTDTLVKRTDDGTNAFSYPLDTDLANPVRCLQTDTVFFYTLENNTTANSNNGQLLIKKWKVQDFVLKLQRTYTLNGIASQKYDANTFAIENYVRSFSGVANSGSTSLTMNDNSRLQAGDILELGPSTFTGFESQTEEVTVLAVSGGGVVALTTPLTRSYNSGNKISFANRCWIFNKFRPSDPDTVSGSGQLYSFDLNPLVTTVVNRKQGNEFRSVLASSFIKDNFYGSGREFLVYANQTNLLFIEVEIGNPNFMVVVESAAQNNQETDSTVIPIHDLAFESNTLFRLQQKGTFRNNTTLTTENWTPRYNYQLATMQRIPTSISLTATPAIIAADGVTTSTITAIVRDQFDNPIASRLVSFTDDDTSGAPAGLVTPTSATTNSLGIATTSYKAGTIAKTVTITAQT